MRVLLIGASRTTGMAVAERLSRSREFATAGHSNGEFRVGIGS